jgi:transcriptional regulator with XRE-family HTH domain
MSTAKGFFAERLRELRRERGLSQAGLSGRSGVAVSTIRQFEYGRREPTYGTLVKLAAGLGLSLAAFDQTAADGQPAGPAKKSRNRGGKGRDAT